MENRIKIGDVWYVREDQTEPTELREKLEIIMTRVVLIETNHILVEGSVLENKDGSFSMPSVQITFKNVNRDTEYWDNDSFLSGLVFRNPESIKEMDDIDDKTKEVVMAVVDKMYELNYI